MSSGGKAAPDVDLRARGGLSNAVTAIVVSGLAYYYLYGQASDTQSQDGDANLNVEEWYIFWWLVWLFKRIVQILFGIAFLLLVFLVARQRSILYVPVPGGTERSPGMNPSHMRSPDYWNMNYESIMITTEDGIRVNAWFIYHDAAKVEEVPYTVLYFHGNAGNIGHRLENLRDMHMKLKLNIVILDYRCYGDSDDAPAGPTEKGFLLDAMASYRWLVDRIKNPPPNEKAKMSLDRILFFGRSIGGVVALRLGAELLEQRVEDKKHSRPLQPLPVGYVLENTFTSLRDMAVTVFPFLYYLSPLLRWPMIFDEWKGNKSLEYLTEHGEHWCICLLSGLKDQLVPPAQMAALRALMDKKPPKVLKYFKFPEGGHNDTHMRGGQEYWNSFQKFMDLVIASEPGRIAHFAAEEKR